MDEIKDKGIYHSAQKICDDIQNHHSYKGLYEELQKLVTSPNIKYENFKDTLMRAMKDRGLECQIRNNVYHWITTKRHKDYVVSDSSFFKKAQIQWDKRIHKSLNSMCNELGITLARSRSAQDLDELSEKWGELSNYDIDISKYRPVYAPKDFLEVLLKLQTTSSDQEQLEETPVWEFSHLPIKVKDLQELRSIYTEFSRGEQILGSHSYTTAFEAERIATGEKVLKQNYAPLAQEFLKKGCPRSLRAQIWTLVLNANVSNTQYEYFESLKSHTLHYDLMTDKLIFKDIQLTATNDDQYFVFEDVLYQAMLCFSRDSDVLKQLSTQPGYMQVILKGKQPTTENTMVFPPSGVIPFHGFTMYAAPICYLFQDPVQLYFVFREFYLRYWHRLHRVCGHPQGIVAICLLFERLLQQYEPTLWHHFKEISIPPIKVVFKWLMRAFSGYLCPEQLLQLWDLILAYDTLEIIAFLAVVIMIFRKDNLLKVSTAQNIESVLADLSSIQVIPLLQMALLKDAN